MMDAGAGGSARASLLDNLPSVTVPTLVVCYMGDNPIYPEHAEAILKTSPAADKSIVYVDGDHFGFSGRLLPERGQGPPSGISLSPYAGLSPAKRRAHIRRIVALFLDGTRD
jgi:hypothetical protein